jgi:hypothetical protein
MPSISSVPSTSSVSSRLSLVDQIHARAVEVATRYKRDEAELVDVIQQVQEHRVYLEKEYSNVYEYVVSELRLSENVAQTLVAIAKKARQVPELKTTLQAGGMTLSNARRVVSVLTPENKDEWIKMASELSNRKLEKEIARIRPQELTPEKASYVTADRMKLEVGLSEGEMLRLRRVQDLLSQSMRRSVSLEETLAALSEEYLRRHDPMEKARRHQIRKGSVSLENEKKGLATAEEDSTLPISAIEPKTQALLEAQSNANPLVTPQGEIKDGNGDHEEDSGDRGELVT